MTDYQAVADNGDEARANLKNLNIGLGGDAAETAVVLGRTTEEIEAILDGEENVDEDLEIKVRAIAEERKINLS
jgi:hypothetical protein